MRSEKTPWSNPLAAVEISFDIPEGPQSRQQMFRDLGSFFTTQMSKRRGIEIQEKHLTEAGKQQFREAKAKEVKNFIAAEAFRALPPELKPSREQASACAGFLHGSAWTMEAEKQRLEPSSKGSRTLSMSTGPRRHPS